MADLSYRVNLENPGHYRFTMPDGFDDRVEVHLWGAGGGFGAGGASGGFGGYTRSVIYISAGSTVDIGIGGVGQNAADINTPGSGGISMLSKYRGGRGGGRGRWCGNVKGPMASAGGGGATAIDINGTSAAVAGGGGGGGGYGHKGVRYGGYNAGYSSDWVVAGTNGGNATWGGGGGGGYAGGSSGYAAGHAVIGGNGGTSFGDTKLYGTAISDPRQVFGTPVNVGNPGFNGYAVIIFTRKKSISWKRSNGNVRVVLSGTTTITANSIVQQEYSDTIQGNAIVRTGTSGGNTIVVSYLDSNVFVTDSGNVTTTSWTGNLILPGDVDANVYPISTTDLGDWVQVANVYYKATEAGIINNLSSGEPTVFTYNQPGTYTFTAPANVRLITVKAKGAGGGGGGNDSKTGATGLPGDFVTDVINVTPGHQYSVVVGAGGGAGATTPRVGGSPGGRGGSGIFPGGAGGTAGTVGWSGGGGGGGGASGISGITSPGVLLVAAGGGGGGGAGNNSNGQGVSPGGYAGSSTGGAGAIKSGDGGGGGGGGGGYPLGGAGGAVPAGDVGGYTGATGQSYATFGPRYQLVVGGGGAGGSGGRGDNGSAGYVEISYHVYYYLPGTWVPVDNVYYKVNGVWENLVSRNDIPITKLD